MYTGTVVELHGHAGLAYVETERKERFVFLFGAIEKYRGESAKELGLKVGSQVQFKTENGKVVSVKINESKANRRKRRVHD